jgi:hypothetical protein
MVKERTNEGNSGSNYPQDGGEELKFNNYERHEKKEIVSEEEKQSRLSLVYVTSPVHRSVRTRHFRGHFSGDFAFTVSKSNVSSAT